jgi:putative redox protein
MMKTTLKWQEKMAFTGEADGHRLNLDAKAPLGAGGGMTPKELLPLAVSGCTAMDVAALMKKHKQPVESLEVEAEATMKEGSQPAVFLELALTFKLTGQVDKEKLLEAVRLSQTRYCGVSAMLAKSMPIHYRVILNEVEIGHGEASFL